MPMEVRDKYSARRTVAVLAAACVALQAALSPQISLGGGTVNFMLILTGAVALYAGGRAGCIAGFLAGAVYDFTLPVPAGLMMLILSVTGFLLGGGERNRMQEQLDAAVRLFAIACVAVNLVYSVALVLLGVQHDLLMAVFGHGLASTVLDVLFSVPVLYLLARSEGGAGFSRRPSSGLRMGAPRHQAGQRRRRLR